MYSDIGKDYDCMLRAIANNLLMLNKVKSNTKTK
uniref:Uncharacterized protein n=1 Tax=Rhizophora mucronata TaxID=61149 RepID=A0A2P2J7Y9_RHIMU